MLSYISNHTKFLLWSLCSISKKLVIVHVLNQLNKNIIIINQSKHYLIESKNSIYVFSSNVLWNSNLSLKLIASYHLRSITPQLIITKRPENQPIKHQNTKKIENPITKNRKLKNPNHKFLNFFFHKLPATKQNLNVYTFLLIRHLQSLNTGWTYASIRCTWLSHCVF